MHDKIMKRVAAFVATLALALSLSLAASSPAQASWGDCTGFPGTICMHQFTNGTGAVWRQYPSQMNGCINLTDWGWNDRAGTAYNQTSSSYHLSLYEHIGCNGSGYPQGNDFLLASGQSIVFTGNYAWWNDRISSIRLTAF